MCLCPVGTRGMTLQLECPVDGCAGTCEGDSEEAVLEQAKDHVANAHPDLDLDDETVDQLKADIQET